MGDVVRTHERRLHWRVMERQSAPQLNRTARGAYIRTTIRWGVAFLLAGLAAWLSVRQVQWARFLAVLTRTDLALLALALATVLGTTAAKVARWHVLLRLCGAKASWQRVLRVLLIGQMANSFLPRLGDIGRGVLLGPQAQGGIPAVLGTILAEKALDGIMGLLILLGLALWTPLPAWLRGPIVGLAALTGGLLLLLALAARQRAWASWLHRRLAAWMPASMQARAGHLLSDFALGLGLFRQPANTLVALALSAVVWSIAAATNVATLAALGIDAPPWSTWLVLVTGYAATFLPTVPAQIGVFEYACILALGASGVEQEPALAFGLILHLLVQGPPAILGPVCMGLEGLSWSRLQETQRGHREQGHVGH